MSGVAAGAAVLEPKRLFAGRAIGVLMDDAVPIDILKVAVFASAHKTDRRDLTPLAVIAAIMKKPRGL